MFSDSNSENSDVVDKIIPKKDEKKSINDETTLKKVKDE